MEQAPAAVVYGLFASDESAIIRYVGSTTVPAHRLRVHRAAREGTAKDEWISEVHARSATVEMIVIAEFSNFADARVAEKTEIRRRMDNGEPLLNRRAVGAGQTPGTRFKLDGQALANHQEGQKRRRERERDQGVRYVPTAETSAKQSAALRARWAQVPAEQRSAAMSAWRARRPPRIVTDEQRQRIKDRPRVCCVVCRSERQAAQMSKHLRSGKCRPVRGVKIWVSCVACRMTVLAWYFERHLGGQSCTRGQKKLNSRVYKP